MQPTPSAAKAGMDTDGAKYEESRRQEAGGSPESFLGARIAELGKLQEKLTRAKDESVQSWLDSKPLIDELEKLRSELADAKNHTALSNTRIPELETQADTLNASIKAKKEEELKVRAMINTVNQVLQKTQADMEQLKTERDEKHRARLKLKQVLRLRRQTLQTLQLTLRAIRLESEAYGASATEADGYINHSQMDEPTVELTQEEYRSLVKRAREETSLAEWRVSVSMEQKQVAKESKESATKRFKDMHSSGGSRRREHQVRRIENHVTPDAKILLPSIRTRQPAMDGGEGFTKNKANSNVKSRHERKLKGHTIKSKGKNKKSPKRKTPSCFTRISALLVQKMRKIF